MDVGVLVGVFAGSKHVQVELTNQTTPCSQNLSRDFTHFSFDVSGALRGLHGNVGALQAEVFDISL